MSTILHINCNYVGTKLHKIMVNHFDKKKNTFYVFSPQNNTTDISSFIKNRYEYIIKCFSTIDRIFYFKKQKKIYKALVDSGIPIDKIDIVHAFTLFTDGNIAYKLYKKYKKPYIVAIRDTDLNCFLKYKPYLKRRGYKILKHSSAVIFLSKPYMEQVLKKMVPKKDAKNIKNKSYIIPNGIDDYWLTRQWKRDKSKNKINKEYEILCVAKINKRKNIPILAKAINKLNSNGWNIRLTVIGKKEDKKEYYKLKNSNVHIISHINKESLIDYYRKADIFALVSKTETFGLVYAEAMSQSLPLIYTEGQGFDGQFKEGTVGYSARYNSIDDIAGAIIKIDKNYDDITRNSHKYVERFNWKKICKEYQALYRKIINAE